MKKVIATIALLASMAAQANVMDKITSDLMRGQLIGTDAVNGAKCSVLLEAVDFGDGNPEYSIVLQYQNEQGIQENGRDVFSLTLTPPLFATLISPKATTLKWSKYPFEKDVS